MTSQTSDAWVMPFRENAQADGLEMWVDDGIVFIENKDGITVDVITRPLDDGDVDESVWPDEPGWLNQELKAEQNRIRTTVCLAHVAPAPLRWLWKG